jgi:phage shock protein A
VKKVSIIDRIKMNLRANLNDALDKAEDPQKMLDQTLLDMKESIQEFKRSISDAIVGVKKLEREIAENIDKAKLWEDRAVMALKSNNEELAKKAVDQKLICFDNERRARTELNRQKQAVEELKASLPVLEAKLNDLYLRRNDLIKKSLQMKMTQSVRSVDAVSELGIDSGVFSTYDAMVDKIRTLEDHVEALAELSKIDEVEVEFKKLERKSKIDAELNTVKESIKNTETS